MDKLDWSDTDLDPAQDTCHLWSQTLNLAAQTRTHLR